MLIDFYFSSDREALERVSAYKKRITSICQSSDKTKLQSDATVCVFGKMWEASKNFKKSQYWPYPFSASAELQAEATHLCEFLSQESSQSDQQRGVIDYCFRRRATSILQAWINNDRHSLFYDQRTKSARLLLKYLSEYQEDAPIPNLWEGTSWLPEGAKQILVLSVMLQVSGKKYDPIIYSPAFLMLMASQSGLGVMSLTRELWCGKELSFEDVKKILLACAESSGIRILPLISDFVLEEESFLDDLVQTALDHSKPEHFYAFHPSEISYYLSFIPIRQELSKAIENQRLSIAPHSISYSIESRQEHSHLIRKWKASVEEPCKANHMAFNHAIEALERADEEKVEQATCFGFIDESFFVNVMFQHLPVQSLPVKKTPDEIKLEALKKLFPIYSKEILQTLALFRIKDEKTMGEFFDYAFQRNPTLMFSKLPELDMPQKEKLRRLFELSRQPRSASLLISNFNTYQLSLEEESVVNLLRQSIETLIKNNNHLEIDHLGLDPSNELHARLIESCVRYTLQKRAANEHLGLTVFAGYRILIKMDPRLSTIEPLLAVAQMTLLREDTLKVEMLHEKVFSSAFAQLLNEACAHVSNKSPEIANLLAFMWKKRKIEKLILELSRMDKHDPFLNKKRTELHEANRCFKEVIKAYILIDYDPTLDPTQKQEKWRVLSLILTQLESMNFKPDVLEAVFKKVCETAVFYQELPSLVEDPTISSLLLYFLTLGKINHVEHREFYEAAEQLLKEENRVFESQEFIVFLSALCNTKLPLLTESLAIAFLLHEIADKENKTSMLNMRTILMLAKIEEVASRLPQLLTTKDTSSLEEELVRTCASLFSIPETDLPLMQRLLREWSQPELIFTYYTQWKSEADVISPLAMWLRAVVRGESLELRFKGEDRLGYFSTFPEEMVLKYQEENIFDLERASGIWKSLEPKPSEKSLSIIDTLRNEAPSLFQCAIGEATLEFDDLSLTTPWNDHIKKIKKYYSADVKIQKEWIDRLKVLKNLVIIAQSDNKKISLKAAKELQNLLGSHQQNWKSIGFTLSTLQKINPKLAQFIAFCKESNPYEGLRFEFTHDPQTLFTISEKTLGSCQSITRSQEFNKALIGRIHHGKQKLLVIKNEKTGEPIGVMTVKLLKDTEGNPVLLREPVFQCTGCALTSLQLEEIATIALLDFFQSWNVPFLVGVLEEAEKSPLNHSRSPYFEIGEYAHPIKNSPGKSSFEYEDTRRLQVQTREYTLPTRHLLEFRLKT